MQAKSDQEEEAASTPAAVPDDGPQIAVLAEQVKELKETINILVSQIMMLRSELKKTLRPLCLSKNNGRRQNTIE